MEVKCKSKIEMKGKKLLLSVSMLLAVSSLFAQQVDLTLQRAIEIALAENPTIHVADKDIELKKVASTEAWQSLLPSVDGSLALSHSIKVAEMRTSMGTFKMGMDGSTTAQGGITVALPLFAPAVYQNMKLTKEDILLAQEKARGSRLDLINQVTKAYYGAMLSSDSYEVMKKSYEVAQQNYNVVEQKFNVGKVSEYDKISAEVQMRSMNSSMVSAESGKELALLQLKVLMGINPEIEVAIADDLKSYEGKLALSDSQYDAAELDNNSALRQLDQNASLLQRTRKILSTNFMPTVAMQLQGQYQSMSNDNWNVFKYKYSPSLTLAFNVSVPIYHASNFTKLKSNKLQQEQLGDTRLNTYRQLNMAAESYRKNMASNLAQVESNAEAVKQADKAVNISSKRYEVGRGTILELNQSETALTQAELTYMQSIYNYLVNKADLDYTLGRE
ncbi:MAG: TolC family protein [Prevotellaceae bacterium]|nr:TolC family protein [Candidatus Colivivens caballi]